MNARLSFTACSASGTLRWRPAASVRTYAATSSAAFLDITSSTGAPLPETGCAAPIWVPGAIAATSAAMVMMNPADAARAPEGPTKITTGVEAASIRDTMARVDSRSPPGVRKVKTTSRRLVTIGAVHRLDHEFGGDRVDDALELGGVHKLGVGLRLDSRGLGSQRGNRAGHEHAAEPSAEASRHGDSQMIIRAENLKSET